MKNSYSIFKFTILLIVLLSVIYPLTIYGIAQLAPNQGKGEIVTVGGKKVGYQKIGQKFDQVNYFWGRPSAVDYNAAGSGGSNKGATNETYLALVQQRINHFLTLHPYLEKKDIPSEMVTASGSGLDPNISPQAALIQVKRIAKARQIDEAKLTNLVLSKIESPIAGPEIINVLELNVALDALNDL